MRTIREATLFASGLLLGTANAIRHKKQGYLNPRPFSASDVERTVLYASEVVDRLTEDAQIEWSGARVLEIGPGSDLLTGAVILSRGAVSYHAVDLFDNRWQADPSIYERISAQVGAEIHEDDLGFTQTSFPALPDVTGPYDLIISNACLEHVADVGGLFLRLHELAAPSARMVHHIDGKAHMRWFRDHDPLNPLRYPDIIYRRLLEFPGAPNRLRAQDFVELACTAAWDARVVPGRRADPSYVRQTKVIRRFREYQDLDVLHFTLVGRIKHRTVVPASFCPALSTS